MFNLRLRLDAPKNYVIASPPGWGDYLNFHTTEGLSAIVHIEALLTLAGGVDFPIYLTSVRQWEAGYYRLKVHRANRDRLESILSVYSRFYRAHHFAECRKNGVMFL